jgi:hypothetical protein
VLPQVTPRKKNKKEEEGLTQLALVIAQKVKLQVEKFRSDEQKQSLESKFKLVQYRQMLRKMGAPEEEINLMFPLPVPAGAITVRSSSTAMTSSSVTHASSSTGVPASGVHNQSRSAALHTDAVSTTTNAPVTGETVTATTDVLALSSSSNSETDGSDFLVM